MYKANPGMVDIFLILNSDKRIMCPFHRGMVLETRMDPHDPHLDEYKIELDLPLDSSLYEILDSASYLIRTFNGFALFSIEEVLQTDRCITVTLLWSKTI